MSKVSAELPLNRVVAAFLAHKTLFGYFGSEDKEASLKSPYNWFIMDDASETKKDVADVHPQRPSNVVGDGALALSTQWARCDTTVLVPIRMHCHLVRQQIHGVNPIT